MSLLEEHPLRHTLNDEVHARPPMALEAPEVVTYLAYLHHEGSAAREGAHLEELAHLLGVPAPESDSGHVFLDAGEVRFKWERHNEFSSYTFVRRASRPEIREDHACAAIPVAWREAIPGRLIIATHVVIRSAADEPPQPLSARLASGASPMVVSRISHGAGWVFTDFRIHDGFSRFLILTESLTPRQIGRTLQRMLEIETYRVISLLAFPVAKRVASRLSLAEDELADLVTRLSRDASSDDERHVLQRLTHLAAGVEQSVATTSYRFGAAAAYYDLLRLRIDELREIRVTGFPTIREFMERRLSPALATCATVAQRQEDLSERVARNSQLLRTRVEVDIQRQNQELLEQMNRRAKLQLRLQETVEGLSIVAITYYGSQLVHYLARGAAERYDYAPLTPDLITAAAIPVIATLVFLGTRRMRRKMAVEENKIDLRPS